MSKEKGPTLCKCTEVGQDDRCSLEFGKLAFKRSSVGLAFDVNCYPWVYRHIFLSKLD